MKKNIMHFATELTRIASVIDVTICGTRVEFKAHKSIITRCLNTAFIYDLNVTVFSIERGYYQAAAFLNQGEQNYEEVTKEGEE